MVEAPAPGREAERTFGRDMDRLRGEGADAPPDRALARKGEADFAIGGAGNRAEQVGRDHLDRVPCARSSAIVA